MALDVIIKGGKKGTEAFERSNNVGIEKQ